MTCRQDAKLAIYSPRAIFVSKPGPPTSCSAGGCRAQSPITPGSVETELARHCAANVVAVGIRPAVDKIKQNYRHFAIIALLRGDLTYRPSGGTFDGAIDSSMWATNIDEIRRLGADARVVGCSSSRR
jgi:hypothetical protein